MKGREKEEPWKKEGRRGKGREIEKVCERKKKKHRKGNERKAERGNMKKEREEKEGKRGKGREIVKACEKEIKEGKERGGNMNR